MEFVLGINNQDYSASLAVRKIYLYHTDLFSHLKIAKQQLIFTRLLVTSLLLPKIVPNNFLKLKAV